MRTKLALVLTAVVTMTALVWAQKVNVDYDRKKDFSQYHTYAWGQNNANKISNPDLAKLAAKDIDAQLQARGLQLVEQGQSPDLIVLADGGTQRQTSYSDAVSWGNSRGTTSFRSYSVGTLVVNLYYAKSKQLLWYGVGSGTLEHGADQKNQKLLTQTIAKMFQQYPVSPKK